MKKKTVLTISFTVTLLALLLTNLMVASIIPTVLTESNDANESITASGWEAQADWHEGTEISTDEVTIAYTEIFGVDQGVDSLSQNMELRYGVGQGFVGYSIGIRFAPGGLDVPNEQVLDWNKVIGVGAALNFEGILNGTDYAGMHKFNGFQIVNGTPDDIQWEMWEMDGGWRYGTNSWCSTLDYANQTQKIGHVTLDTRDYTYDGRALKESIATFNVTVNASIWDGIDTVYIPVILQFRVTRNATATTWKYGVDVDWSAHKDFPCYNRMTTGDDFTLIAEDRLGFRVVEDIGNYSVNAENDTAIFSQDGVVYARQFFTTNYLINGSEPHNTTRIFIENSSSCDYTSTCYQSMNFVIFDGFKYNQSTGFTFDPYVVCNVSEFHGGIPWNGLLIQLLGLLALISISFSLRRTRKKAVLLP